MRALPWPEDSLCSLLIRTDYGDDQRWHALCRLVETPVAVRFNGQVVGEFRALVQLVDDPDLDSLSAEQLVALAGAGGHGVAFLADAVTLSGADQAIVAVDLVEEPGRTFRVIPSELWNVQNNLAVGNAAWDDYADHLGPDGVFRGLSG